MEGILNVITQVNASVNSFVWGPIMLVLLVGTGIYISIRTGMFQLTKFGHVFKNTIGSLFSKKKKGSHDEAGIKPFHAVSTALAGTVGTGNIVGVATAISLGGPGAVFWMWLSAFFGMMTKYSEAVLAVHFREKDADGLYHGGPMYYIEKGLNKKWLASLFAFFCMVATFGTGNMVQANAISGSLNSVFHIPGWVSGIIIAVFAGLVIVGGIKRIGNITSKLIPFMSLFYIVSAVIILFMNGSAIPEAFGSIFKCAFGFESAFGGVIGYTVANAIRFGLARGVFSNEAGLGSAAMAHGSSNADNPVKQGLWGIFEVFLDTIVICSLTALVILTSDIVSPNGLIGVVNDNSLTAAAFNQAFGSIGGIFLAIALICFASSTILGWAYYGETSLYYLSHGNKKAISIYRILFLIFIVIGATMKIDLAWGIADTLNGLMAIPNLIGILGLSGIVVKLTKEYKQDLLIEKHKNK